MHLLYVTKTAHTNSLEKLNPGNSYKVHNLILLVFEVKAMELASFQIQNILNCYAKFMCTANKKSKVDAKS